MSDDGVFEVFIEGWEGVYQAPASVWKDGLPRLQCARGGELVECRDALPCVELGDNMVFCDLDRETR